MRAALLSAIAVAAVATSGCPGPSKSAAPTPVSEDDKTLYALGLSMGQNLRVFNLTDAELAMVQRGLEDQILKKKPLVELKDYGPKISMLARARSTKAAEVEKQKGASYLAEAEKESGAQKLPSGVIYIEKQAGTGEAPAATSQVKVNYRGTLTDGTEFDSSYKRNAPAEFPLNGVVRCWTEGLQKMKTGGKAKLVCPPDTAYGDRGGPGVPGGATLTFEVELLEVKEPPAPPAPPPGMNLPSGGLPPVPGSPQAKPPPAPPAAKPPQPPQPAPK